MSKITDLTASAVPDSADLVEVVDVSDTTLAATGTNKKLTVADLTDAVLTQPDTWLTLAAAFRQGPFYSTDFHTTNVAQFPFVGAAISSGTTNAPNAGVVTKDHPGCVRLRSSATANGGYRYITDATMTRIGGGEVFRAIFRLDRITDVTVRCGFLDNNTSADAVDGCYIEMSSGTIKGKTANNSTRSTTTTDFTPSLTTWYRVQVEVNDDATLVTYRVFNDAGTELWSDTLATNIPTASGRETGVGIVVTESSTTAYDLLHLDYMAFNNPASR